MKAHQSGFLMLFAFGNNKKIVETHWLVLQHKMGGWKQNLKIIVARKKLVNLDIIISLICDA